MLKFTFPNQKFCYRSQYIINFNSKVILIPSRIKKQLKMLKLKPSKSFTLLPFLKHLFGVPSHEFPPTNNSTISTLRHPLWPSFLYIHFRFPFIHTKDFKKAARRPVIISKIRIQDFIVFDRPERSTVKGVIWFPMNQVFKSVSALNSVQRGKITY